MSTWQAYLARARELPLHVTLQRAGRLLARTLQGQAERLRNQVRPTYGAAQPSAPLRRRLRLSHCPIPERDRSAFAEACARYLQHRFDLLGSGWTEVRYGISCAGLEGHRFSPCPSVEPDSEGLWLAARINPANLGEARRIWRLIRSPYVPIDWQLDFKSGFRWSEKADYRTIRYGDRRGADVKVPWELARVQHLPQLALAYGAAMGGDGAFLPGSDYLTEIRNQILDFIATNPPRFGVNWACAMDVGIRVVNLLVTVDLLRDAGAELDAPFLNVVSRSVREHALHVLGNLEWSPESRGNHYLADIVGLLFAAAYLPRGRETDAWTAFAVRELIVEGERQFLPDGGSIEASTNYHRLSAEMMLFAAALILGFDAEEVAALVRPQSRLPVRPPQDRALTLHGIGGISSPLPPVLLRTLVKAARFTRDVTRPDGQVVQWGDNDSGRLLKLQPAWVVEQRGAGEPDMFDDPLDHRAFVAAAAELLGDSELAGFAGPWIDGAVVAALARGQRVPAGPATAVNPVQGEEATVEMFLSEFHAAPEACRRCLGFSIPPNALNGVVRAAYPHFGYYLFRADRFFLAIRCPRTPPSLRGHVHDDTLAIELQIDGHDLFVDPGTYVYTPLPDERNAYRIAGAHSVPRPAGHQGLDLSRGLFDAGNLLPGCCRYFGPRGFLGKIVGDGWSVERLLLLQSGRLMLMDLSSPAPLAPFAPAEAVPSVCWGYGRKTARPARHL